MKVTWNIHMSYDVLVKEIAMWYDIIEISTYQLCY